MVYHEKIGCCGFPVSKAEYSETNTYFMFNNVFVYEKVLAFKRLFAKKNFE